MKLYPLSFALATALVGALSTTPALAQRSSYVSQATQGFAAPTTTGGRLPFTPSGGNGSSFGGSQNGYGSPFGSGTFGGGSNNGSPFGSGMNSPFGQNGMNGNNQSGLGNSRGGGQQFQQGGFVGRDANDVRAGFQATERVPGQGGMLDQVIDNLNEMRESRRRWREQRNAPPPIHVQLIPGFQPPAPSAAHAAPAVQNRLNQTFAKHAMGDAAVQLAGRTAVLRGSVSSDHERALAEMLASLEPGVAEVQNLLTVTPPPAQ
jgi:hypothetical protein